MCERVQEHCPPRFGLHPAALERSRFDERRPFRTAGQAGRFGKLKRRIDRYLAGLDLSVKLAGARGFHLRIALAKDVERRLAGAAQIGTGRGGSVGHCEERSGSRDGRRAPGFARKRLKWRFTNRTSPSDKAEKVRRRPAL
jgi:hypothetical protein